MRATVLSLSSSLLLLLLLGCASFGRKDPAPVRKEPTLLGPVTREAVEQAEPEWVAAELEAEPDAAAVEALRQVAPGASMTVYLGTWCGDSRRELARFWRAMDEALGMVPIDVEYIAVDRYDQRPPELEEEVGLRWVPTFIVHREGEEVGRVVEIAPTGIEQDLLTLLDGSQTGVLSGREDLGD